MTPRRWFIWAITFLLLPWSAFATEVPGSPNALDTAKLDSLLKTLFPTIRGQPGRWEAVLEGVPILIMSQDAPNRMRAMAPVAQLAGPDVPILLRLLEANFSTALDVRYALYRGVLWSVFIHPLDSLTEPELRAGLQQVVTLVKTTGTTYSSSQLSFESAPSSPGASQGVERRKDSPALQDR